MVQAAFNSNSVSMMLVTSYTIIRDKDPNATCNTVAVITLIEPFLFHGYICKCAWNKSTMAKWFLNFTYFK